jgi:ribosomal protein S18 acetylase RimI-like enzyme
MFEELKEKPESEQTLKYKVETIKGIKELDEQTLKGILDVEQASFPEEMQSDLEDLKETLKNKRGIQVVVRNGAGEIVSYLSSKPLGDAYEELKEYDPKLKSEQDALYIESIATKPEFRNTGIFLRIINTIAEEAKKRGYKKIFAHARVENNLSGLL